MADQRASVFVGRDAAVSAMGDELRAAAGGDARIVRIEGVAGIGKTSLLRTFVATAGNGHRVIWAAGAEEERSLAFGLIEQLANELSGLTDIEVWSPGDVTDPDPLAVGARLLAALGEVDGSTILVIDDLHWVDIESANSVLFMLRRLRQEVAVVLIAARPDPAASLSQSWGRFLRDHDRVRSIVVEGLTVEELISLSEATTGVALDRLGAERLQAHTGGHPMHARSLLEELGTDALKRSGGVLPAPRSLAVTLVAKVAALPGPAHDLVAASAVLGGSRPLAVVAGVAGVTDPLTALDAAVAAGVLERGLGDEVRVPHPLIRGAVYNDLAPTARRDLHLAAMSVTDGVAALDHRVAAAAGSDPVLAADVEALAHAEVLDGRPGLAEAHFRAAGALFAEVPDRDRCELFAAEAVDVRGDHRRLRSLQPKIEAHPDSPLRSYLLGAIAYASGDLETAERLGTEVYADLLSMPGLPNGLRARAATGLAMLRLLNGRWEDATGPARAAVELGAGSFARYALAMCLSQRGQVEELRALADQVESERPRDVLMGGLLKSWMSSDLDGAVADLTAAVSRDHRGPSPRLRLVGLCALSDLQYRMGSWDEAVINAELAVSLATDNDLLLAVQQAHAIAAYVHAGRGSYEDAERHVKAAAELAAIVPTWAGQVWAPLGRAVLAQARGDTSRMRSDVADLLDGPLRRSLEGVANWPWRVLLAEALLGSGELDRAQRLVDGLGDHIDQWQAALAGTDAARLRGRLAQARGDLPVAKLAFEVGLQAVGGLPLPRARLELAYGQLLRRLGDKRGAVDQLRRARQRLTDLGAVPFIARCDDELTACGLPSPRASADPLGLTPAEETVARLVAQGLSNREVAERLYVSAKAVEFHLRHIYAKLGIKSRRELAGRLAGPDWSPTLDALGSSRHG